MNKRSKSISKGRYLPAESSDRRRRSRHWTSDPHEDAPKTHNACSAGDPLPPPLAQSWREEKTCMWHTWINHISIDVWFVMIGQYLKIWNLRVQKNLNIEKIIFKVVQMKFLAMHITNQKLSFDIFMVGNVQNIFMEHDLNILMILGIQEIIVFWHIQCILAIATNILMTGFTFSHLADAFIQMRTIDAIKTNKREMICKCYNKS